MKKRNTEGFTLVELLIVIAIIGILTSIVLVNISISRGKAKDAAIASMANSLMKAALIARDSNTGVFPPSWRGTGIDANSPALCDARYNGDISAQTTCKKILSTAGDVTGNSTWELFQNSLMNTSRLSIMVRLPGSRKIYCVGSEGGTSATTDFGGSGCGTGTWQCSGCFSDPGQQ